MQYVNLGSSTMKVSKVALGTMTFGKMNPRRRPSPSWTGPGAGHYLFRHGEQLRRRGGPPAAGWSR